MPKPRKLWSALKSATQKRKLGFYRKQGLSDSQIRARYNAGTLGPQTAARGHAQTPERPSLARRNPERYERYLRKRERTGGGPRQPEQWRIDAYNNIKAKIGEYFRYNDNTVRLHCFQMMTRAEGEWTINADEEMIVQRARVAYGLRLFRRVEQSPWWYH